MTIETFLDTLNHYKNHYLHFEYTPTKRVASKYHITEVKHVAIDAVDCGSGVDQWNETIVQLWESSAEPEKEQPMTAFKASGILKKVGQMKPYIADSEVKFEYGNDSFHTAQLHVGGYLIQGNSIVFNLTTSKTDCKAKETCGIPETNNDQVTETCAPGSGCC